MHCRYWWIVEDGRVLGAIALRHELNERLIQLGHIGYGIQPSARWRGLATWALGRMLDEARGLGLTRVLIVCEVSNLASAKTIEYHGGVLGTSGTPDTAPCGVTGSRSASRARDSSARSHSTRHCALPALSADSVVRAIGIMYVSCDSDLGHFFKL